MAIIKTDDECQQTELEIREQRQLYEECVEQFQENGRSAADIESTLAPNLCVIQQLEEAVAYYKRLKSGQIGQHANIGLFLIAARIAAGDSPEELAARLEMPVAAFKRLEYNEYYGEDMMMVNRVLEVLGVLVEGQVTGNKRELASAEWSTR